MAIQTVLTQRLALAQPIIQAPMAGGGDTPDLVAAVCEAGGLGFVGAAYLTPEQIMETAHAVRARTAKPFGINLFAPPARAVSDPSHDRALAQIAPFYAELGLPVPTQVNVTAIPFDAQLLAAIESGASAFSFTFGLLPESGVKAVKSRAIFLAGTATTVAEAVALEKSGVDAVIAQGSEAGGHRGTFAGPFETAMVGTMALVPQIVDTVKIPVIASGGIMDGRGIAAALALGASAVQMGTAFLTCDESGVPQAYKQAVLAARDDGTRLTRAFSGRPARGIVNRVLLAFERPEARDAILPFPEQNVLTRPMRNAAAQQGKAEYLSLWAGQAAALARSETASALVARLARETDAVLRRLTPL